MKAWDLNGKDREAPVVFYGDFRCILLERDLWFLIFLGGWWGYFFQWLYRWKNYDPLYELKARYCKTITQCMILQEWLFFFFFFDKILQEWLFTSFCLSVAMVRDSWNSLCFIWCVLIHQFLYSSTHFTFCLKSQFLSG